MVETSIKQRVWFHEATLDTDGDVVTNPAFLTMKALIRWAKEACGTVRLPQGALRWWVASLAYVCSMIVLMGVSAIDLPPGIGQAGVFVGYGVLASGIALVVARANARTDLGLSQWYNGRNTVFVSAAAAASTVALSELAGLVDENIAGSTETLLTNIGFGTDALNDTLIIVTIRCLAPLALYRGLIFRSVFNSMRASLHATLGA